MLRLDTHSMTTSRCLFFLALVGLSLAWVRRSYAAPSPTPTLTPTITNTPLPSNTPTISYTPTDSPTANLTLTPPCGASATYFGNINSGSGGGPAAVSPGIYGSMFTLSYPASIYSLSVYSAALSGSSSIIAGIYNGGASAIGSLAVQSSAQLNVNGWNGLALPATQLNPGTYWLVYMYSESGYPVNYVSGSGSIVYSTGAQTFGSLPPNTPVSIAYGVGNVPIYANFCRIPTATPTVTPTITQTYTPTVTPTSTVTSTPTVTGTINTNTPTPTNTLTPSPTYTGTATSTSTATPNLSITPDCGALAMNFGNTDPTDETSGPITAGYLYGFRACVYNLPVTGNIEDISIYCLPQSKGETAIVGIYSSQSVSMGSLIEQAAPANPALSAGWNTFNVPATLLPPGNYWLAYIFSAPTSFVLDYQLSGPASTLAYAPSSSVTSFVMDQNASSYPVLYNTGSGIHDLIYASYCPASLVTNTPTVSPTPTNSLTITPSPTITNSPTNTSTFTITDTPTITQTPSWTPTLTFTPTTTNSPTATLTYTPTYSPTVTQTFTTTMTPTWSPTSTLTSTGTQTLTVTLTATVTNTLTFTLSPTSTFTATNTGTVTNTPSTTFTPVNTSTTTLTATLTQTPPTTSTSTLTRTATPTFTVSPTQTDSPTWTSSPTPTGTVTATPTQTSTLTVSDTPTYTPSTTNSPTPTWSATSTATSGLTFTPTTLPLANQTPVLYPNPVKGNGPLQISAAFSQPHDYVTIKIFTTAYRRIYQRTWTFVPAGTYSFSLDDFNLGATSNGLYYAVVTTPSDRWLSKLLILR